MAKSWGNPKRFKSPKKSGGCGYVCEDRKPGLEIRLPYILLVDFKLTMILLSLHSKCWDCEHAIPVPAVWFLKESDYVTQAGPELTTWPR